MSNTINIGQGSSKFYCNLIKAYLKNYDGVSVMAGHIYTSCRPFHILSKFVVFDIFDRPD